LDPTKLYTTDNIAFSGKLETDGLFGYGCRIFVQGKDPNGKYCEFTGAEMRKAYEEIRTFGGCKRCGTKPIPDRCMVKQGLLSYHG
jgi:hypothetical protein